MSNIVPLRRPAPNKDFIMFELLAALVVEIHKRKRAPTAEEIGTMVRVLQSLKGEAP